MRRAGLFKKWGGKKGEKKELKLKFCRRRRRLGSNVVPRLHEKGKNVTISAKAVKRKKLCVRGRRRKKESTQRQKKLVKIGHRRRNGREVWRAVGAFCQEKPRSRNQRGKKGEGNRRKRSRKQLAYATRLLPKKKNHDPL